MTGADTVRLWSVDLGCPSRPGEGGLHAVLDTEERVRMDRLRLPAARARFAAAHAALRAVLGEAITSEPAAIRLVREPDGKPRLEGMGPAFNMAHSGDVAAIAVGGQTELGVDVEVLRPVPRLQAMIRYACTPAEQTALQAIVDEEARTESFLELWVRKEAVLKALGRGLRERPARIEVGRGDRVAPPGEIPPMHVVSTRCLGHPAALAMVGGPCAFEAMRFEWASFGELHRRRRPYVIP